MSKAFFLSLLACVAVIFTGCKDNDMNYVTPQSAYGNDTITQRKVVTLKELREMPKYQTTLSQQRGYQLVEDDIQLLLRVTGNDQGGNIYNKVALQDDNGDDTEAIFVTVYASGLYSYLQVGQQVLINLKGLYIGTYGYQRQIGVPYTTASGNTYAGRMPNFIWQQHFKLIGTPDPTHPSVQPIEFTSAIQKNMDKYAGRLMMLKGVTLTEADGETTWAIVPQSVQEDLENLDFSTSRAIKGYNSSTVIYTSTSAKFAGEIMPKGPQDITAIFSRYGTTWQIQMRTVDDCQPAK